MRVETVVGTNVAAPNAPTGYLDTLHFSNPTCAGQADTENLQAIGLCQLLPSLAGPPTSSFSTTITPSSIAGNVENIRSAFSDTQCQSNYTSRTVTAVAIGTCMRTLGQTGSTFVSYQKGRTSPDWSLYGYATLAFTTPAACSLGKPILAETIYNLRACTPEFDANQHATGRFTRTSCDDRYLYIDTFLDASCTNVSSASARQTTSIAATCSTGAMRSVCVKQVPTTAPTTAPPTSIPTPAPSPIPSAAPTSYPSSFPTIPLTSHSEYFAGTDATIAGAYTLYTTIPGLIRTTGSGAARWFLTASVLGTGFTSPMLQSQASTRVTLSIVAKSLDGHENFLVSACMPDPQLLCDITDAGYTTCFTNLDVTPYIVSDGSLRLAVFTSGSILSEGVCKKDGHSIYMRFALSGTYPNPTSAPSKKPPSMFGSNDASSMGLPLQDVFSDFKSHMFIAFAFAGCYLTLSMGLLRIKRSRTRLALSSSELHKLSSFYHLGSFSLFLHILLFASAFVLEIFLASFLIAVDGQHFVAMGAVVLAARIVPMLPNFVIILATLGPEALSRVYGSKLSMQDLNRNYYIFLVVSACSVIDVTFIRFLPWTRSKWTDASHGYPTYSLMLFAVYSKVVQAVAVLVLECLFVGLSASSSEATAIAFGATTLAFTAATILHCIGSILYLLEEGRRLKLRKEAKKADLAKPGIAIYDMHSDGESDVEMFVANPMSPSLAKATVRTSVVALALGPAKEETAGPPLAPVAGRIDISKRSSLLNAPLPPAAAAAAAAAALPTFTHEPLSRSTQQPRPPGPAPEPLLSPEAGGVQVPKEEVAAEKNEAAIGCLEVGDEPAEAAALEADLQADLRDEPVVPASLGK